MQNQISAIKPDGLIPEIKYRNSLGDQTVKNGKRCHQDLQDAMRKLDVHFAILAGQSPQPFTDQSLDSYCNQHSELLNNIEADGFTLKNNAVTISGTRVLDNAKVISIGSPMQSFEMDTFEYPYIDDLSELMEALKGEGGAYLDGKEYIDAQIDMFGDEKNQEIVKVATRKKSKKAEVIEPEITEIEQEEL